MRFLTRWRQAPSTTPVAIGSPFLRATSYRKREMTGRARVTGWALLPNGAQATIDEHHLQRAWREREVASALADADLAPLAVIPFDSYGEAEALGVEAVKLFYVCGPL